MKGQDEASELQNLNIACEICSSKNMQQVSEEIDFSYGVGAKQVILKAIVPVQKCLDCEFTFLGKKGMDIQHEAVCRHLNVMTPKEILSIRKSCNMSQAKFAELSAIGKATINRWENGENIQNKAMDNFLYLLKFPKIRWMLSSRIKNQRSNVSNLRRFSNIPDFEKKQHEAKSFSLAA